MRREKEEEERRRERGGGRGGEREGGGGGEGQDWSSSVSNVSLDEGVCVRHDRGGEGGEVRGLQMRLCWGRAELADVQEQLLVQLLPVLEHLGRQSGVIQHLADDGQVTLFGLQETRHDH